jgi:hypothetical protein
MTVEGGRWLPADFRLPHQERLFDIPPELARHTLTAQPHHEEIIVSLPVGDDEFLCTFLMSQLPEHCPVRAALGDLLRLLREFTEPSGLSQ